MTFAQKTVDSITVSKTGPRINSSIKTSTAPSGKRRTVRRLLLCLAVILCFGIGGLAAYLSSATSSIFTNRTKSLVGQVGGMLQINQTKLIGEKDGQINLLLLGIGGENHDGGYLSDSILLAQIRTHEQKAVITSLPRDLVTNLDEIKGRKINAALAEGYLKNKNWNEGLELAIKTTEKASGQKIPYAAVIDFQGFAKLVDIIGGIEVDVPTTFTDYKFPDGKEGYIDPITFTAGKQKMSGQMSLIYARSRHAAGSEGSDFARSKRQQQIIQASKTRILSTATLTSLSSLNKILQTVSQHVHTNLQPQELWRLYQLGKKMETGSLSLTPETGLICPHIQETSGAYILDICHGKSETDIYSFFKNAFLIASVGIEKPKILIAGVNAFGPTAKQVALQLENLGASVTQLNYDEIQPKEAVFYQMNSKPRSSDFLKAGLRAKEVALPPPGLKLDKEKYDILLVLKDSSNIDAEIMARQRTVSPPPPAVNTNDNNFKKDTDTTRDEIPTANEKISPEN